jgi:hypothetical protein
MIDTLTQETDLLQAGEITDIPASSVPFLPKAHFTSKSREARISAVWKEFQQRFFGKTEEAPPATALRAYRLQKPTPDAPIIEALGGESHVETSIASVFALIKGQAFGQPGPLQVNGYANIFYVRDKDGVLCAVRVGWDGEGWIIDAIPVRDPLAWNGQHQVFCPAI